MALPTETQWTPIEGSSMIAAVAYLDGDLYVRFNKGAEWKYAEVPATVYSDFRAADSLGKFFHAHIRKDYADTAVN